MKPMRRSTELELDEASRRLRVSLSLSSPPMKPWARAGAAFVWLLVAATPALAQTVYSWTDADGVEHFTDDAATVPKGARVKRRSSDEASPPPPPAAPAKRPADFARPGSVTRAAADAGERPARDAPVEDARVQQELPEGLVSSFRRALPELRRAPSGPALLEVAETTSDTQVLVSALFGLSKLYTSRTSVTHGTFDGKPYAQLPANDRVFAVARRYLGHPDTFVRSGAAALASLGIARTPPDERLLADVAARFSAEQDTGVREALLSAFWTCHCGTRAMAESAIWFVEQDDDRLRLHGLAQMAKVGKKGRSFDADTRARMRREAQELVRHPSPAVRQAAEAAVRANALQ